MATTHAATQLSGNLISEARTTAKSKVLSICVAALLVVGIASYFWVDSRYPALLKKLHSGKAIHVSGALSFDALLPVTAQMPYVTRVAYTAVDWAYTNRVGMMFGVFFGAALLTLLAYMPKRGFAGVGSAWSNTALGAVIGTPLGVCANCVAPIGRGLWQAGASPATMLGTMIASPTLNVVVLMMAFTLLPLKLAVVRVVAPLLLLAVVPFLVRGREAASAAVCVIEAGPSRQIGAVLKAYFVNLGKLALATVPWMLVAGVLGALVVELVPATTIPVQVTFLGIVAVALLGTFAPMPIAFDVAFAWILLSRGVPTPYVAALVCTLGAFSIYPMIIVGRSLSWRVAGGVFAAVMLIGVLAGVGTFAAGW